MKLKNFIIKLEKIYKSVESPEKINVRMADNFSVMDIILDGKNIYITDVAKNGKFKKYRL